MIKYILFDLDGTLLPMDQDKFFSAYFNALAKHVAHLGYSAKEIGGAIWQSSREMMKNDGSRLNEEMFWDSFSRMLGDKVLECQADFDSFYIAEFDKVSAATDPNPIVPEIIKELKAKGYTLAIATNPMFPRVATRSRIAWAGLDVADFEFFTTYEDHRHCKPNLDYYRDVMTLLGANAEECIMVGNDTLEDMIAEKLGMKVFLITQCLINNNNIDIEKYPHGTFDDLVDYLNEING